MRLAQLWDDLKDIAGPKSNKFYRTATITWSRPEFWHPSEPSFHVPIGWAGHGGVYTFMHRRWAQNNNERKIVYVGKAISFRQRLTKAHDHFNIIETPGETTVSCGRIAFEGIKHRSGYYEEIE